MIRKSAGFTLIELMIVVAIIGILGSLAISSYQTYIVRAQISEGLALASSAKVPVVEAYLQDGVAPANRTAAGMSVFATDTSGGYVGGVSIVNGRIDIVYNGPDVHSAIAGQTLSLTPYVGANVSTVLWRCGTAGAPAGAIMVGGDPHLVPTVANRYLPQICRP
jgi:type IV pilus assembly protein PilA